MHSTAQYGTRYRTIVEYGTLFGTLLACDIGVILDEILDIPSRARNLIRSIQYITIRYCIVAVCSNVLHTALRKDNKHIIGNTRL